MNADHVARLDEQCPSPDRGLCMHPMEPERLDIHAALNTYETADAPGHTLAGPQLDVVGANHRRLIVRETEEGLWLGGCLIKDKADALALVEFVTDWADNTAGWAV